MTFRFQSKHAFLTYAQCAIPHLEVINKLRLIEDFNAYTASTENHLDGNKHVHVLIQFSRKLRHSDNRRWDIGEYHPNIVCPRAIIATRQYIKKHGDFSEEGWCEEKKPYSKILEESSTKEEFLSEIRQHHTRDYVLQYERICSMADAHWVAPTPSYTPKFTNFLPCTELDEWVSSSLVSSAVGGGPIGPHRGWFRFAQRLNIVRSGFKYINLLLPVNSYLG